MPLPWTIGLYDLCLRLALLYPILVALLMWVVFDIATPGLEGFLPQGVAAYARWGLIVVLVAMATAGTLLRRASTWWGYVLSFAAVAGAGAVAGAVAGALVGTGALVGAVAVALAGAVAFAAVGAVALVGAGAGAVVGAVAVAVVILADRFGRRPIFHIVFSVGSFLAALATLHQVPPAGTANEIAPRLPLLFFILLPLVNAPFDWLSLGATRGLLTCGLLRRGPWRIAAISVADIGLALLLMLPLTAATTAIVEIANAASRAGGSIDLLPLAPIFADLRDGVGPSNVWVLVMLLSTLAPSILHVVAGYIALVLSCLHGLFRSFEKTEAFLQASTAENPTSQKWVTYWYPGVAAAAVTALVVVLWVTWTALPLVPDAARSFLLMLLWIAETTAGLFPK